MPTPLRCNARALRNLPERRPSFSKGQPSWPTTSSEVNRLRVAVKRPPCTRINSAASARVMEASRPVKATRFPRKTALSAAGSRIRLPSDFSLVLERLYSGLGSNHGLLQQRSQPFQARGQINTRPENRLPKVAHGAKALRHGFDGESGGVEPTPHFSPFERRRNSRPRVWADGIGGGKRLALAVLQVIEIDPALPTAGTANETCDGRQLRIHDVGDQFGKVFGLVVAMPGLEGDIDMQSPLAGRLAPGLGADSIEHFANGLCSFNDTVKGNVLGVEVEHDVIR